MVLYFGKIQVNYKILICLKQQFVSKTHSNLQNMSEKLFFVGKKMTTSEIFPKNTQKTYKFSFEPIQNFNQIKK